MSERTITLIGITMRVPTDKFIYSPSCSQKPKIISYERFLERYAGHPYKILVSFEPDGVSNPQPTTAYGYGLDAWWIRQGDASI